MKENLNIDSVPIPFFSHGHKQKIILGTVNVQFVLQRDGNQLENTLTDKIKITTQKKWFDLNVVLST